MFSKFQIYISLQPNTRFDSLVFPNTKIYKYVITKNPLHFQLHITSVNDGSILALIIC